MKVRHDIASFLKTLPANVTLVVASKYINSNEMSKLFDYGVTHFGENRVDSFLEKQKNLESLPIHWHFIGHLQRNKAKQVINKIEYLHSLDSLDLAKIINQERQTPLKCFVEVSINLEENKNGVPYYECEQFLSLLKAFPHIQVVGLMMMGKDHSSTEELSKQFKKLRLLRDGLEKKLGINLPYLSMGMSHDYLLAIKEGATHIRLGRILFEE